jgi:hypothetical protein
MEKKDLKELESKASKYDRLREAHKKASLRRQIKMALYITKAMEAGIAPPTAEEVEREYQRRYGK